MTASCLPQAFKYSHGRAEKIFRRMYSPPDVTEKGAFQVNTPRFRPFSIMVWVSRLLDGISKPIQRGKCQVDRRSHCGGEVTAHSVLGEYRLHRGKRLAI